MEISPVRQAVLLIICVAIGAICALALDIVHEVSLRFAKRLRAVTVFLSDMLVCILGAALMLIFTFYYNNGEVRAFCIAGIFLGAAIYKTFFSLLTRKITRRIIEILIKIFRIILKPICIFLRLFAKISKIIIYNIIKGLENIKVLLYNIYCKSVILRKAENGFFGR